MSGNRRLPNTVREELNQHARELKRVRAELSKRSRLSDNDKKTIAEIDAVLATINTPGMASEVTTKDLCSIVDRAIAATAAATAALTTN